MVESSSKSQPAEDASTQGITAVRLLQFSAAAMVLLMLAVVAWFALAFAASFLGDRDPDVGRSVSTSRELEVELSGEDRVLGFDVWLAVDEASLNGLTGPPGASVEVEGRWIPAGGHESRRVPRPGGLVVPRIRAEIAPIPQDAGTSGTTGTADHIVRASHDRMCPATNACSWPFRVQVIRDDESDAPVVAHLRIGASAGYVDQAPDEAEVEVRLDRLADSIRIVSPADPRRQPVYLSSVDPSIEPAGFVSFVRIHGPTDALVAVRFPTSTTEPSPFRAVVEPLTEGGRAMVSFGGSSTFEPFTGCPPDELCVRQYQIRPLSGPLPDRTPSLEFHAPEGVIVERELADLPPLDDPLTVQASQTVEIGPDDHAAISSSYLVIETAEPMEGLPVIAARLHALLTSPQTGPVEFSLQGPARTISTDRRPEAAIGGYVSLNHDPCSGKRECRISLGGDFFNRGREPADVTWTLTAAIAENSVTTEVTDIRIEPSG